MPICLLYSAILTIIYFVSTGLSIHPNGFINVIYLKRMMCNNQPGETIKQEIWPILMFRKCGLCMKNMYFRYRQTYLVNARTFDSFDI